MPNELHRTYVTVAASSTDQNLSDKDVSDKALMRLIIIPATIAPGAVSIKDSAGGGAITVYAGSAAYSAGLEPMVVELHAVSQAGSWHVTTGANVSVIAIGKF